MSGKEIYKELAGTLGVADSQTVPLILEKLADLDAAKVLMAAAPPATIEELAEKTGLDKAGIPSILDDMFKKGMIYKSRKPDGTRYYRCRHLIQFHDANIVTPGLGRDILDLWKEFDEKEWPAVHAVYEELFENPVMRVIPVDESIRPEARIMPFDDITKMVESAEKLAVVPCTCRLVSGDCGKPVENCIQVNKAAEYTLERGTGKELTKDQTFKLLEEAREAGLVHVVDNRRALGHIICNCCEDCCISWPDPKNYNQKFTGPSRYTALVDTEECASCETCIERCHFGAISMDGEGGIALIDEEKCMGCGLCISTCPVEAMGLKEKREEVFIPE